VNTILQSLAVWFILRNAIGSRAPQARMPRRDPRWIMGGFGVDTSAIESAGRRSSTGSKFVHAMPGGRGCGLPIRHRHHGARHRADNYWPCTGRRRPALSIADVRAKSRHDPSRSRRACALRRSAPGCRVPQYDHTASDENRIHGFPVIAWKPPLPARRNADEVGRIAKW